MKTIPIAIRSCNKIAKNLFQIAPKWNVVQTIDYRKSYEPSDKYLRVDLGLFVTWSFANDLGNRL